MKTKDNREPKSQSFSESLKKEIFMNSWSETEKYIFLISFIRLTSSNFKESDSFKIKTTHFEIFDELKLFVTKHIGEISHITESKKILSILINGQNAKHKFDEISKKITINSIRDISPFISGAFYAKGWLSDPIRVEKANFEIRVKEKRNISDLVNSFELINIPIKKNHKNDWTVLYLRRVRYISDTLRLMKAPTALFIFEDENIRKSFINYANKEDAITPYNQKKVIETSNRQIPYLKALLTSTKVVLVPQRYIDLGKLRIKYPSYSLLDLSITYNEKYNDSINKSTTNSWLRKLYEIYKEHKDKGYIK